MSYYCKNCKNIIAIWNNVLKNYNSYPYCIHEYSEYYYIIHFLNCVYCNKFVGLKCYDVCKYCFGENQIYGEENLFNWFLKYKKVIKKYINSEYLFFTCDICNNKNFRWQYWFFGELTFYK